MENFSFDSYDPDSYNEYSAMGDMDSATGSSPRVAPKNGFRALSGVGQVDVLLTNSITASSTVDANGITKFDLFNYNRSISQMSNTTFSARIVSGLTFEEFNGPWAAGAGIFDTAVHAQTSLQNKYVWSSDGSLYLTGATAGLTAPAVENLKISCRQLPYKTLLNSSQIAPFFVSKMRLTVPSSNNGSLQINQDFTHTTNTFLGAQKTNPISPRAFFNPNQYQTNIVDIKAQYAIDGEKGLSYQVVNALDHSSPETTTVTFFIPAFEKPTNASVFR